MSRVNYTFFERMYRLSVFQNGVTKSRLERILLWIFAFFLNGCSRSHCFDAKRAQKAEEAFESLGAEFLTVKTPDKVANIRTLHMKANILKGEIEALGGEWKREEKMFVIVPPTDPSDEWKNLEKKLLRFKWPKKKISGREVIVTSDNANLIPDKKEKTLFLHSNSASVTAAMLWGRAGFYLGCQQDFCFYDPRGAWKSTGVASEAGYYNDLTAVYGKMKEQYAASQIWVTAACSGVNAAASLRKLRPKEEINLILENGFTDLKEDWIDRQMCIARKLSTTCRNGLSSRDIPTNKKPEEVGFSVDKLWKEEQRTDLGKVVVIGVRNDDRIGPKPHEKLVAAAKRVYKEVHPFLYGKSEKGKNPHDDRYFKHRQSRENVLGVVFSRP